MGRQAIATTSSTNRTATGPNSSRNNLSIRAYADYDDDAAATVGRRRATPRGKNTAHSKLVLITETVVLPKHNWSTSVACESVPLYGPALP
jgi:hypothetical protein